ncbi:hypothetical protein ACYVVU_02420 [Arenicellales bacterium IMCC55707]
MSDYGVGQIVTRLGALVFIVAVFGCSSINNLNKTTEVVAGTGVENDPNTNATDDSPYARNGDRQVGSGFSLDIFGNSKNKGSVSDPEAIDPEYAEYLEWKRWQEFKAYQAWKAEEAAKSS